MAAASATSPSSPTVAPQPSPWHSPVPYLFGGLAAMMALISFALLVLACSYWKLSGYFDDNDNDNVNDGDVESGEVTRDGGTPPENCNHRPQLCDVEEKCLVIMAGEDKPTFLATPSSSRTTSFGSSSWRSNLTVVTESGSSSSSSEVEMSEVMRK